MLKLARGRISNGMVAGAIIFMVINVLFNLYIPSLTANIINLGVVKKDIPYIWHEGGYMLLCAFIAILAAVGNSYLSAKLSQGLGRDVRSDIFKKVLGISDEDFEKVGTSSLITRTTNDVTQVQNVVVMFFRIIIMAPIMLLGASFLAYQKNHELMVVFLVALPVMAIFIAIVMYFAVPLFKQVQKKTDRLNLIFREGLTGVRVIRAFLRDKFEIERFDRASRDFTKTSLKVFSIMAIMFPVMVLVMSLTNISIIWMGGHLIADMNMNVGDLVAFMSYAMSVLMGFMMLSLVFAFIPRGQAAAARINDVLDINNEIKNPKNPEKLSGDDPTLVFDHVDFKYNGAEKKTLDDIDFTATKGQTLAIIGGTGSGKSTIVNMIPRLFDVTGGSVLVNGDDVRKVDLEALRAKVAYSPQKTVLFRGTIRENIKYGNEKATDEQVWHALRLAKADEFVNDLDGKLDAKVEQSGDNFSGGQKQRLSIARALIKDASVYIFDDSFSALDFKTDSLLRKGLKEDEEMKNKIIVIVGQRISTIADADEIIVLDNGKQVGNGTHQELKANNTTYQEIVKSQMKGDDING